MGFDPAYRTGCKIAVIDETGKVLDTETVYPTAPQNDYSKLNTFILKTKCSYRSGTLWMRPTSHRLARFKIALVLNYPRTDLRKILKWWI